MIKLEALAHSGERTLTACGFRHSAETIFKELANLGCVRQHARRMGRSLVTHTAIPSRETGSARSIAVKIIIAVIYARRYLRKLHTDALLLNGKEGRSEPSEKC